MQQQLIAKCPLPLAKLDVKIKYAELQKPTGIGYIILVLIKESQEKKEKLVDVLLRFGVPEELHFIFSDEIDILLAREILVTTQNIKYNKIFFAEYAIGHFSFTAKGERMFREGAIPTGEEKNIIKSVYYNPLTLEYSYIAPKKVIHIEQAIGFPSDFMKGVEISLPGLKEYLVENTKGAGLKDAERILNCEISNREDLFIDEEDNLELNIDDSGVDVIFKTEGANSFYEKYFSVDILEKQLNYNKKFVFDTPKFSAKGLYEFNNLSKIYYPEQLSSLVNRTAEIFFSKEAGKITLKRNGEITSLEQGSATEKALSKIYSNWSFIAIDSKEIRYYTASELAFREKVFNKTLKINLLVEQSFGMEQKVEILNAIFEDCKMATYSVDYANIVKALFELTGNISMLEEYVKIKISAKRDKLDQLDILLKIDAIFTKITEWGDVAVEYANEIYGEIINNISPENAILMIREARKLEKIRKSTSDELLSAAVEKLAKLKEIDLFNILIEASFTENEALSYANIIKNYVDRILTGETTMPRSNLAYKFEALANNLHDLKENLGIVNTMKYSFKDNYNITGFMDDYKAYIQKLSSFNNYRGFDEEGFKELDKYKEIMEPVFDYITVERNSSSKPDQISKSFISKEIESGDYKKAISNMHIRLEWQLANILKANKNEGSLELINHAREEKLITDTQADILHELRKFRNKLQHPTQEKLIFDKKKIEEWANVLFSIKEIKTVEKK